MDDNSDALGLLCTVGGFILGCPHCDALCARSSARRPLSVAATAAAGWDARGAEAPDAWVARVGRRMACQFPSAPYPGTSMGGHFTGVPTRSPRWALQARGTFAPGDSFGAWMPLPLYSDLKAGSRPHPTSRISQAADPLRNSVRQFIRVLRADHHAIPAA